MSFSPFFWELFFSVIMFHTPKWCCDCVTLGAGYSFILCFANRMAKENLVRNRFLLRKEKWVSVIKRKMSFRSVGWCLENLESVIWKSFFYNACGKVSSPSISLPVKHFPTFSFTLLCDRFFFPPESCAELSSLSPFLSLCVRERTKKRGIKRQDKFPKYLQGQL